MRMIFCETMLLYNIQKVYKYFYSHRRFWELYNNKLSAENQPGPSFTESGNNVFEWFGHLSILFLPSR